jgi:DNA mismatch endonuclease, patch repair protein
MDILTREQRSARMRRVRQAGTKPEIIVRRLLWAAGYRYRLNRRDLPGSPDVVLAGRRKAIFVHGCFWHRHPGCPKTTTPRTNADYWLPKLAENCARDARAIADLEAAGWDALVVWECETRDAAALECTLDRFLICSGVVVPSDSAPERGEVIAP